MRLSRLLRRDAGAEVDRLYRRHAGEVLRYALLVLRSRSDAEDVTQAVFMRALRALERGEKVRTPRNWLIKIAHNECRRLLASRKLTVELDEGLLAAEPEETGRAEELKRALSVLPETQRRALVLRELEGRSYAEIAAALSLSVSAVETLIFRARRSLREQLEGAMSCEEFAALLEDPSERSRVRAHARICAECATLERQARGRKSALKRIASALGLPWWVPKLAAVAITTATVAGVASAVPPDHHGHPRNLISRSEIRLRPSVAPVTAHRPATRPAVAPAQAAPLRGTRAAAPTPASRPARVPARRAHSVVEPAPVSAAPAAPAATPVPAPTAAPKQTTARAPQPTVTSTLAAAVPATPALPVALPPPPTVAVPTVTVPAVTVPVTVPTVTVTTPSVTVPPPPPPPPLPPVPSVSPGGIVNAP